MSQSREQFEAELRSQGPRRFSRWDASAFEAYLERCYTALERYLHRNKEEPFDEDSLRNYLRLIYEGVGAGWLCVPNPGLPTSTFLAHLLSRLVPPKLPSFPREQRPQILRDVWNLGEGLARQPEWLNQYAIAQTTWTVDLAGLAEHLTSILTPVLVPPPPARWEGRFALNVLDLCQHSEAFLPGRLYLAAPLLLCVEDRLDSEETIGILLQRSQESKVLGTMSRLPEYTESLSLPDIQAHADSIDINGVSLAAPLIAAPRDVLCAAAGFVAVTAEDSQRLWLVEST